MRYRNFLLIDDDKEDQEIFLTALQFILSEPKFTAMTSAKTALAGLNAKQIIPDIIFLDLNMPIMTGQEFLKAIKQIDGLASIPVIVISTSANPATIETAKLLGAAHFITKPSRFDALVSILEPLVR